jgi:hypothetical protein
MTGSRLADLNIPDKLLALLTFCLRSCGISRPLSSPSSGSANEILCAGLFDLVEGAVGKGEETDCRFDGTGGGSWFSGTS